MWIRKKKEMRQLLLVLLLIYPIDTASVLRFERLHTSDVARLKCDALLFRTAYRQGECYFVLSDKMTISEANAACPAKFRGASRVDTVSADEIWEKLGVDKDLFHTSSGSEGYKNVLCLYSSPYTCDQDATTDAPGKCAFKAPNKMGYNEAVKYCASRKGDLPTVTNDAENEIVRDKAAGSPMWTKLGYNKGWSDPARSFGRFAACKETNENGILIGAETDKWCPADVAVGVSAAGYWNWFDKNTKLDVLCVRDAGSPYFTPPAKTDPEEPTDGLCAAQHTFNKRTGKCQWTGPSNACVRLDNNNAQTMFVTMAKYPVDGAADTDLYVNGNPIVDFNDVTVRAIVRYGCSVTFYDQAKGSNAGSKEIFTKSYGSHVIPSVKNGMVSKQEDGLSRVTCKCEVATPPTKCQPMHRFNSINGMCDWTGPFNGCVRLENHLGDTFVVRIPNYLGTNKHDYDLTSTSRTLKDFNELTVNAVVRKGCSATFYDRASGESGEAKVLLKSKGYGSYVIPSTKNGLVMNLEDGLSRVSCECEADPPPCAGLHHLNTVTGKCEWHGAADGCMRLENYRGELMVVKIPNFYGTDQMELNLASEINPVPAYNKITVGVVIRKGCTASMYDRAPGGDIAPKTLLDNKGYGMYELPSVKNGLLANFDDGISRVSCKCPDVPRPQCAPAHKLNTVTGKCEWTAASDACVQLENALGETMPVRIPHFPHINNVDYALWSVNSSNVAFNDVTIGASVRKGCSATFYDRPEGGAVAPKKLLDNKSYGSYVIPSIKNGLVSTLEDGLSRVTCRCNAPRPPCEPLHKLNTVTGKCEWTGPAKGCVQLENDKGQFMVVEIPNYPKSGSQDFDFTSTVEFSDVTVRAVVRKDCTATFYDRASGGSATPKVLLGGKKPYGWYEIPSIKNGQLTNKEDGLSRVACTCPTS